MPGFWSGQWRGSRKSETRSARRKRWGLSPAIFGRSLRLEALEDRCLLSVQSLSPSGYVAQDFSSISEILPITQLAPGSNEFGAPSVFNTVANAVTNSTAKNPQSKVWFHGSDWWSVFATATGTYVWKLNGSTWNQVLQLSTTSYYADVKPVGDADVTYALLYSAGSSKLAKLTASGSTYNLTPLVSPATPLADVPLSSGSDTATIDLDTTGRMWVASDTTSTIEVRYSDSPYTSWSSPITLATGTSSSEVSAIIAMPNNGASGQIGVMWSNHNAERFGFRVHNDGANPNTWLANEVPASQSAQNVGSGMADDHINVKVAEDGTLYAAVKTAYDANTMTAPEIALLVRRPQGTWDPLYAIDGHGTRQVVGISDQRDRVVVLYAGETGVDDIVYKDFAMTDIDPQNPTKFFNQPRQTLLSGGKQKNVSSTKQSYGNNLVSIATAAADTAGSAPFSITGAKLTAPPLTVNQPPVNFVPGTQTTPQDTPLTFSTSGSNVISISDPDAGSANVRITLAITGGVASLGSTASLTVSGNGSAAVTATGTIAALNTGLNGLVFTPTAQLNGTGAGAIQITTSDLGNTGSGGSKTDTDTVSINITASTPSTYVYSGVHHEQIKLTDPGDGALVDLTGGTFLALEDTHFPENEPLPSAWPARDTHPEWESANEELYPVTIRGSSANVVVSGGTIVGLMDHRAPWHVWKQYSDGAAVRVEATGTYEIKNTFIKNVEDGIDPRGTGSFYIHDVYMDRIHDDMVENDTMLNGIVADSYLRGHSFLSARGTPVNLNAVVQIRNTVVELMLQPHQGDHGPDDINTAGGYPFPDGLGNGSIFKWADDSGTVDVRDSVFLVNRPATSSFNAMEFAPGTYSNVTVVWLGGGDYPWPAPSGVTITSDRSVYDQAVSAFFSSHPQFSPPLDWHNASTPADVDDDNAVSSVDLFYLIDALNTSGSAFLPSLTTPPTKLVDVNGDNNLSAFDLIKMVEALNTPPSLVSQGDTLSFAAAEASQVAFAVAVMAAPSQLAATAPTVVVPLSLPAVAQPSGQLVTTAKVVPQPSYDGYAEDSTEQIDSPEPADELDLGDHVRAMPAAAALWQ